MQLVSQKYIQNSRNAILSYLMCRGGFSPDGNEKPGVPRSIFFLVEKSDQRKLLLCLEKKERGARTCNVQLDWLLKTIKMFIFVEWKHL